MKEVKSIPEKWRFMALPYFVEACHSQRSGSIKGLDIDYVNDKEAWAGFSFAVRDRIGWNDFVINWRGFEFKPDTAYTVYLRAKAQYHDLPSCVEKMFEFGVIRTHEEFRSPPSLSLSRFFEAHGHRPPWEVQPLPDCGVELWHKWNLTKNRWYIYKVGKIIAERDHIIYLNKLHKAIECLFIDCAWLLEEGKENWTPPFNWYKADYDDSSWDESKWVSVEIDPGKCGIVLLRQEVVIPREWEKKGYIFLEGDFDIAYLNGEELQKVKEGYMIPPSLVNYEGNNLLSIKVYTAKARVVPIAIMHLEKFLPLPGWTKTKEVKSLTFGERKIIAKVQREKIKSNQLSRIDFVIIDKDKNNPALRPVAKCKEKNFPIAPAKETGYFTTYVGYTEPGEHEIRLGIKEGEKETTNNICQIEVTKAPLSVKKFIFASGWWDSFNLEKSELLFDVSNPCIKSPEDIESYYQKAFKLLDDCGINTIYIHPAVIKYPEGWQEDKIVRLARKYGMEVIIPFPWNIDTRSIPLEVDPREIHAQYKKIVDDYQSKKIPVCAYAMGDEISLGSTKHSFWYLRGILQDIDPKPVVNKYDHTLADTFRAAGCEVVVATRSSSWRMCKDADEAGVILWHKVDISRMMHYDSYSPESVRLKSYLAIAHGAKGLIYFNGISYHMQGSTLYKGESFVDAKANPTEFYEKVAVEVGKKVKNLEGLFMNLKAAKDIAKSSDPMITLTTRANGQDRYVFVVSEDLNSSRKISIFLEKNEFKEAPMLIDMITGERIYVTKEDFAFDMEIGAVDMKVLKIKESNILKRSSGD